MMEYKKTKVDIIVEVLGTALPEIKRLVWLDQVIRDFSSKVDDPDQSETMDIEVVAEWATLMDQYYQMALEKKEQMN